MDDKDKISLNKKTDLLKLSISQLMNTKLYNFKGNYYNELFKEAINLSQNKTKIDSSGQKSPTVQNIQFSVKFVTEVS